jgi:hypothetical protein
MGIYLIETSDANVAVAALATVPAISTDGSATTTTATASHAALTVRSVAAGICIATASARAESVYGEFVRTSSQVLIGYPSAETSVSRVAGAYRPPTGATGCAVVRVAAGSTGEYRRGTSRAAATAQVGEIKVTARWTVAARDAAKRARASVR